MSYGAVMAGAAFIKLTMDDAALQQGLNRAQKSIGKFQEAVNVTFTRMNIASTQLASIFTAINMPVVSAIKSFAAFDDRMRQVQAVTGATGKAFDQLTAQARKLGAETSFTASQVSEGMLALGRMGLNPKEIEAAIRPMMNLSRATGTDLGQSAEIAANNMRVFGLDASKMSHVADILSVTANSSAQTLGDLGEALKMAGPHAKRAGADLTETSASLGILANMGIRGSMAGTALGKSYKRLADPKIISYLKEYGVETLNADGSMRKMRDTLVDIAKAMKNMTNAEQITFAEEVFDARGSLGGGTLSVNTAGIDQLMEKLKNSEGAAQRMSDVMENGIGGTLRRMASAAEGVSLAFGEILAVSFLPLINIASKLCEVLRGIIKENAGVVGGISRVLYLGLGLGAVVKVFFVIGGAIKSMLSPLLLTIKYFDGIVSGTTAAAKAEAAKAAQTAAATENAEKLKALATEKSNADRTVSETRRHYIEMQNAIRSASMTVASEKQKLEAVKAAAAKETAIEAKKLSLTQTRCNLEMAAEEKKLQGLTAIRNAELANNEKARLAYSLQNGSSAGFKNTPELISAERNLSMQEKITTAKTAAAQKEIVDQQKIISIKTANYQKEIAAQEKLIQLKMQEQSIAQKNVTAAAAGYSAARSGAGSATSAQNAFIASLDAANKKSIARAALLGKLSVKELFLTAVSAKRCKVILATSVAEMVAAKRGAGASALRTAAYYAEATAAKSVAIVTQSVAKGLTWMVKGRGEFLWAMTSHQMALHINMNRKKGTKAVNPSTLNPFIQKEEKKIVLSSKDSMNLLKSVFCKTPHTP